MDASDADAEEITDTLREWSRLWAQHIGLKKDNFSATSEPRLCELVQFSVEQSLETHSADGGVPLRRHRLTPKALTSATLLEVAWRLEESLSQSCELVLSDAAMDTRIVGGSARIATGVTVGVCELTESCHEASRLLRKHKHGVGRF